MDFDVRLEAAKDLYKAGKFKEALALAEGLTQDAEKEFGPEDPRVASALHEVAEATYDLGERAAALPIYLRSLAIREKTLPADHLDLALSLNCVANCYSRASKFEQAATLHARALTIRRKVDPASELVGQSLNNIGNMRMDQRSFEEAKGVLEEAVAIWEKTVGPENEKLAIALSNLGTVNRRLGKLDEAERLYRRSLAIKEKALAPGHPGIATGVSNLAVLLSELNRPEEAEALFQRSITILEERLGSDNPRLEFELIAMAFRLEDGGKFKEAEALLRRTVASREKRLGPDHLEVVVRLIPLSKFLLHQGRSEDALATLSRALEICVKAGDEGLRWKGEALEGLAAVAEIKEDLPTAERLYLEALDARERTPNGNPMFVARTLNAYAGLCQDLGRFAKAQTLYLRAIAIYEDAPVLDHDVLGHISMRQARVAGELEQFDTVEPWVRSALSHFAVANPPASEKLLMTVLEVLERQYQKAPGLLDRALRMVSGPREKPETWVMALEKSLAQGKVAEARRLLERAAKVAAAEPALVARVEAARKALPAE